MFLVSLLGHRSRFNLHYTSLFRRGVREYSQKYLMGRKLPKVNNYTGSQSHVPVFHLPNADTLFFFQEKPRVAILYSAALKKKMLAKLNSAFTEKI